MLVEYIFLFWDEELKNNFTHWNVYIKSMYVEFVKIVNDLPMLCLRVKLQKNRYDCNNLTVVEMFLRTPILEIRVFQT